MMYYRNWSRRSYCRPFTTATSHASQYYNQKAASGLPLQERPFILRGTIPVLPRGVGPEPTALKINQYAEMTRCYTYEDVMHFTSLIGDQNPIHQLANTTAPAPASTVGTVDSSCHPSLEAVVVPGLLVGSIFSAVIGTLIPGAIYAHQSYDFRHPVQVHESITGRIVIAKLRTVRRNSQHGIYMICQTLAYQSPTTDHKNDDRDWDRSNHNAAEEMTTTSNIAPPEIPPALRILIRGEASVWIPDVPMCDHSTTL